MKILTIGDSFTYGDELEDRQFAWPEVLASKLDAEVTNLGKSAAGNTSMVRAIVEHAANYDIVIVAWSHYARMELADNNGVYDIWPGCSQLPHRHFSPHRSDAIKYITAYNNDDYSYQQYLLNIVLAQSYLKQLDKKYIMIDAFGNNLKMRWAERFATIRDQIDPTYFMGWSGKTMMEWAFGTPIGPNGHFLEEGHALVADKIYEYIRDFSWLSRRSNNID